MQLGHTLPESSAKRESPALAASLLSAAAGGLIISSGRHILGFDKGAQELTGLGTIDALSQGIASLPHALQELIQRASEAGASPDDSRIEVLGRKLRVHLEVTGTAAQRVVVLRLQDEEAIQAISASLERLDRLANLGIAGASIAHEVKNALVAIRTFFELQREQHGESELSGLVAREISRIDAVVKQLLRGASYEAFSPAPLGFHAFLEQCGALMRQQFQSRQVQLTLACDAARDRVRGDERQLRHAFMNLLINALEAVPDGGRVMVRTTEHTSSDALRVEVQDNGRGITPEHLPRLFDPFFTTKQEGTGLGLAITRRIIEEHGGTIVVRSTAPEGTTFEICLPLA
jgi:two-component system, NtrC family, sensor histidine kinase HydH